MRLLHELRVRESQSSGRMKLAIAVLGSNGKVKFLGLGHVSGQCFTSHNVFGIVEITDMIRDDWDDLCDSNLYNVQAGHALTHVDHALTNGAIHLILE